MLSSGDTIRGFSWNGREAYYCALDPNDGFKTGLFVQKFDGTTFAGAATKVSTMSTGDNFRGLSIEPTNWFYIAGAFRPTLAFDGSVSPEQRKTLTDYHNYAYERISMCISLSYGEKKKLYATYSGESPIMHLSLIHI